MFSGSISFSFILEESTTEVKTTFKTCLWILILHSLRKPSSKTKDGNISMFISHSSDQNTSILELQGTLNIKQSSLSIVQPWTENTV